MGDNAVKKIIKIIVPLVLIFVCVTGAFAQGTLSEEILNQAKREAGLFLELKSALGLDWLDEYNAYLENPTSNPEPSWDLSVADLVNGGYLSDSFPSDFTITKAGQEVKISKIITSQAMKDVLPIYLPSVTIAGDVVSLIVQRPEQWVAWQAGLLGKVSRDGSDNPDILPNAVLDFGKGSEIRFINNDGKLVGINSLTYKGQELEDRFVNAAGDNMTGPLKINGNIVWHAGNDGSGSGLDADLLEGQHGSFYQNAGNLNAGIVPVARLSGTYDISISGRAAVASNADYASNSDKLNGKDSSDFALAGHTHNYVSKTGDTMTGTLTAPGYQINDANTKIGEGSNNSVRIQTNYGYVDIGPQNTGWVHFNTDRPEFYFDKPVEATNMLKIYNTDTWLTGSEGRINNQTIWHRGNDGSGSGLDADLLDGKNWEDIKNYIDSGSSGSGYQPNGRTVFISSGTWTKKSDTKFVMVYIWGGGGGGGGMVWIPRQSVTGGNGGTSSFGSYCSATGGKGGSGIAGGAGGTGIGGDVNLSGETGGAPSGEIGGAGGRPARETVSSTVGAGGHGTYEGDRSSYCLSAYGGGGGGYAEKWIDVQSISSVYVTVGAGGVGAVVDGIRAGSGKPGLVIVEEYK